MNKPPFVFEPASFGRRDAYRTGFPGLVAKDLGTGREYTARDISAGGVSLEDPEGGLPPGAVLALEVLLLGYGVVTGLKAEVARRQDGAAALRFLDPTQRQVERLDKLVLEVQKYYISKGKDRREAGVGDEHET